MLLDNPLTSQSFAWIFYNMVWRALVRLFAAPGWPTCFKVMLQEMIRKDNFERNIAWQCWNNAATIRNNVTTMI